MNEKTYTVTGPRTLSFPDGQTAEPGSTFKRAYDPVMEAQHLRGGHIQVVVPVKASPTPKALKVDTRETGGEG